MQKDTYKYKQRKRRAFTLVELLIVIAIIAILFIVLVSKVDFATDKAKATGVQTDFRSFQVAIEQVARENSGLATFGWDTGDINGDRVRNSYDKGDANKNGIQDNGEVFVGSKTYGENWTNVYTLTNPADADDNSAIIALESSINANLDPKLHIAINNDLTINMANGAQDPWNTEYHGYYITNATVDSKDRGAIIIYSNGANQEFGSEHKIANGVVTINVPGNNVYGKDDYSVAIAYTYVNGYGEVKTTTSGFSNNQGGGQAGNDGVFTPEIGGSNDSEEGEQPDTPTDEESKVDEIQQLVSYKQGGINAYSWSQIQALADANLTSEEYKTLYGIELGQTKDNSYLLVDLDGNTYDGFVFIVNWARTITSYYLMQGSPEGGYASAPWASEVNNYYTQLPSDLQQVIKEVTIKCNDRDDTTIHTYTCKLFLPSYSEFGGHATTTPYSHTNIAQSLSEEGKVFDFFIPSRSTSSLRSADATWNILTRSINNSHSLYPYFRVQTDENKNAGSYTSNGWTITPAFVVGANGNSVEIVNKQTLPVENPTATLETYSWIEIKALANAKLTANEYKSKYGIELGQTKDNRYTLIDFNKYDGFVFMCNSESNAIFTGDTYYPGYIASIGTQLDNDYNKLPANIRDVIKKTTITFHNKVYGNVVANATQASVYCFIPSLVEYGVDISDMNDIAMGTAQREGSAFEWLTTEEGREYLAKIPRQYPTFNLTYYLWTRTMADGGSYTNSVRCYIYNPSTQQWGDHLIIPSGSPTTISTSIAYVFVVGGDCIEGHYDNNSNNECDGCLKNLCELGFNHMDNNSDGYCDACNIAYCYYGTHVAKSGTWYCESCNQGMCSLGYTHNDMDKDGDCDACWELLCNVGYEHTPVGYVQYVYNYNCKYCSEPMCSLGFGHLNNNNWICYGCNQPMCSVGSDHKDTNSNGYCNGCNIVYCVNSQKHIDQNLDGLCEWCGAQAECDHKDISPRDSYCDICSIVYCKSYRHRDMDGDNACDWCKESFECEHEDTTSDNICDFCCKSMCDFGLHVDGYYENNTWHNQDGYCDYCNANMKASCKHRDGEITEEFLINEWNSYQSFPYVADGYYGTDGYCDICGMHTCEIGWYGYTQNGYAKCDYCGQALCTEEWGWYEAPNNPHDTRIGWYHDDVNNDGKCDGCNNPMCWWTYPHSDGGNEMYENYWYVDDGYCDYCGQHMCELGYGHYDSDGDAFCDFCWTVDCYNTGVHGTYYGDTCDGCGCKLCPNKEHGICEDWDYDGVCDDCGYCPYYCDDWDYDGVCDYCGNNMS